MSQHYDLQPTSIKAVNALITRTARASRRLAERLRRSVSPRLGPSSDPTSPTRSFELFRRLAHSEKLTATLLLVPAAGSFLLTYLGVADGMSEGGETIAIRATAILFAASVGILSWLIWFFLFIFAPRLRGRRLAVTLSSGFLFSGALAGIDAPFIMVAIAGDHAVQMSLVEISAAYEQRTREALRRAGQVQALGLKASAEASRFEEQAASEERYGTHSGRSGPGKVSSGFTMVGSLLRDVSDAVETAAAETLRLQALVTKELATLKTDAFRRGAIRERSEAVAGTADRLDELLSQVERQDLTTSVKAILTTLDNIFPAPVAAQDEFEERQNAELGVIAEMARPVADSFRAALAELDAVPEGSFAGVRPEGALDAIYTYWRPLLPHWLAAHFVDVGPFLLLIISLCVSREAEAAKKEEDDSKPRRGRPRKAESK